MGKAVDSGNMIVVEGKAKMRPDHVGSHDPVSFLDSLVDIYLNGFKLSPRWVGSKNILNRTTAGSCLIVL